MKTIRTWWGHKFIEALESFTDSGRLARGRGYATGGRILDWEIGDGAVSATIRGNVNPYYGVYEEPRYQTRVALTPIGRSDWADVIAVLGSQAAFVAQLLLDEMPDNIERPFQQLDVNLLPRSGRDLKTHCSCPDYENPCKHVAGLCYFLAARLDADPFLLFELRGLARDELLAQLRQTPLGQALADNLEAEQPPIEFSESFFAEPMHRPLPERISPEEFWTLPKRLPDHVDQAAAPIVPASLIKKGGEHPDFWGSEKSFIETMEAVYEAVRKDAKHW